MNAASQLFRALAIIGAIAAGVLFYLTNGRIEGLNHDLSSAKTSASSDSDKANKSLKDAQDQIAANAADLDKAQKDRKAALDDADLANKRLQGALSALDDSDKASKQKDAKISDLTTQMDGVKAKADMVDDLNKTISSQRVQIADLETQVANQDANKSKPADGATTTATSNNNSGPAVPVAPVQLSAPASAKILQVNTKSWILVLDVGTDNGVQKDAQLYLKLGTTSLGTVQVIDSQAKMATCSVTGTDVISPKDYSKLVTPGLQIQYQRGM